jgi:ribosomal protein S28E/S33
MSKENKMENIKGINYRNATVFKMKNRRAIVGNLDDGRITIQMRIMDGSLANRSLHRELKGKVVETYFNLSEEAALCLYYGLQNELSKRGIFNDV